MRVSAGGGGWEEEVEVRRLGGVLKMAVEEEVVI